MIRGDREPGGKFRAIIFDLDGTLLNTLDDIADSVNRTLEENGCSPHAVDAYRSFIGDGWRMLVARALPEDRRSEASIETYAQQSRKIYRENWNRKTQFYAGIPDLLDQLQEQGVPLAVLSNKPHDFTLRYAEAYLSRWAFAAIMGFGDRFPPKPDPAAALQITRQIGLPPSDFLFVGDSSVDMQTAHGAGMHAVGVAWGFRGPEELLQNGCHTLVEQPLEIVPLLDDRF